MSDVPKIELPEGAGQEEIRKIENPLAGVNPKSLDAIMAEDVELISDQDVDRIVEEHQRARALWAQNEAEAQAKPKGTRGTSTTKGTVTKINLDDLGL